MSVFFSRNISDNCYLLHVYQNCHTFHITCSNLVGSCVVLFVLIVFSSGDDLLACGPEEDGVLELRRVATLPVAEWGIRFNDSLLAEILQGHQIPDGEKTTA